MTLACENDCENMETVHLRLSLYKKRARMRMWRCKVRGFEPFDFLLWRRALRRTKGAQISRVLSYGRCTRQRARMRIRTFGFLPRRRALRRTKGAFNKQGTELRALHAPACARKDSNLRPLAPEASALSTELRAQTRSTILPDASGQTKLAATIAR